MSVVNNDKATTVADTVVNVPVSTESNGNQKNNNKQNRNNMQKSAHMNNRIKNNDMYFKGETVSLNSHVMYFNYI